MVPWGAVSFRRALVVGLALAACGGPGGPRAGAPAGGGDGGAAEARGQLPSERERQDDPSASTIEPFAPTSGPGDAPVPFVRDERSSRLEVSLPHGRARELWRAKLEGDKREACRACSLHDRSFVLTAGNRVAVVDGDAWQLFDTWGRRIGQGKIEGGAVRLDRAGGTIVADDTRPTDLPARTRVASHAGLVVTVDDGAVHAGERSIEGKFEAFDVAIDEAQVACVPVRQGKDLVLWTIPLVASGSIGRQKIPFAARRALGPPVLGKRLRVLVLDTGLVALGPDGKKVWERRGFAPSGGVSVTADDVALVADGGRIFAIDPRGKSEEVWGHPGDPDRDVVFVSPPILSGQKVLYVVSGSSLHAIVF
jgi:hypothetical protein